MDSPSIAPERALRRHDLVHVSRVAWQTWLQGQDDLAGNPLIRGWVERGWPLVARRAIPSDIAGVALGLPLPPFAGKIRIEIVLPQGSVVSVRPPLLLAEAIDVAPRAWRPTLRQIMAAGCRHGTEARLFGSLAWHRLTRLDYLGATSDVDLLFSISPAVDAMGLADAIGTIARSAPMRLDGEFVRADGAAVNWKEFHPGASEVLVKTMTGIQLMPVQAFTSGD